MSYAWFYQATISMTPPLEFPTTLDWSATARGRRDNTADFSFFPPTWNKTKGLVDCVVSYSMTSEATVPPSVILRAFAEARTECGWSIDFWHIEYVASTTARPNSGGLWTENWSYVDIAATAGDVSWNLVPVVVNQDPQEPDVTQFTAKVCFYPHFVFSGTGRLLGTPAGGALVGYDDGAGVSLVIDS